MRKKHKKKEPGMLPEDAHLGDVADKISEQREAAAQEEQQQKKPQESRKEKRVRRKSEKNLKKKAKKLIVPKTVQDTIPYARVYPDTGIIETEDGIFTKTYLLEDINYQAAREQEQQELFLRYAEMMNTFDSGTRFEVTVVQQSINLSEFEAETMVEMEGDGLDEFRREQNDLIRSKIREGKNELIKHKYLTVSQRSSSYAGAVTAFARQDDQTKSDIKKIGGAVAEPMSAAKRLELLHDIYNPDAVGMFGNHMLRDHHGALVFDKENFRFDIMRRMGLTTKDMIAPASFHFGKDHGKVGSMYFRALFLRTVPQELRDSVLKDLTDVECKMVASLTYQPIDGEVALKMADDYIRNVNANLAKQQEKAGQNGHSAELVNPELKDAAEEAASLRDDLTKKDQKLFYMTMVIVHFAKTKEQLDSDTKAIQAAGRSHLLTILPLTLQQEGGLNACLPLCCSKLDIKRSYITESAAVFMPFVNQELNDREGGMYYGINAVSRNLIRHNRRNSKNGNGCVLGQPGGGKSMAAKQEMTEVLLGSQDNVVVIDPEGEYYPMAELLGGEVIRIAPGEGTHLNPFDIEMNTGTKEDPITQKSDFICSLCETVIGERIGLTAAQKSIIDRNVKRVYKSFLASYDPATGSYDKRKLPTLLDFYLLLREEQSFEAMQVADGLEFYATGTQNLFAHHTNVAYNKRFVVYDLSKMGTAMKNLAYLVILNNIWNRMISGFHEGNFTWVYVDEGWELFMLRSSAEFIRRFFKLGRKHGGIPTFITQNVTDILENDIARTVISNSEFILMLSQSQQDRAALGELLNISPTQMDYITNAGPGRGLLYDGEHLVPFINELPKDTRLYEVMTTKPAEVQARQEREKAAQRQENP